MTELSKQYDPRTVEPRSTERWLEAKAFAAAPKAGVTPYVIMMPLPNVTGALHMGHAIDNVMQDLLIRWHRMMGDNALWMAGTDHAGIGTQAVVEKRLFELEGKTRHDLGREALVQRIWEWKGQYQERIVRQQQAMGCSCDWDRQRFTMDAMCARSVRRMFFAMFRDGLIYQGHRLVNWDCQLQTAVADDELYKKAVQGHFWHLRYPVIDPQPGEPTHIVVATTRPETMLGDTAVACHPDPAAALTAATEQARAKLDAAPAKERDEAAAELERLQERAKTHLPQLQTIAAMARNGRQIMLPLQERTIPILLDEWAKPELGSGCVKITPAHDPNDYDVWQRHRDEIDAINVLEADGKMSAAAGADYAGLDRFAARKRVVADLDARGLLDRVEDRTIEIDHSDRSKTIIEPLLSKQWFVRMGDVEGGVLMGRGTEREFRAPGLAQAAIDACDPSWRSASGRQVAFHPDDRYRRTYIAWLAEKRDWCISRQLWWGHQIPVWRGEVQRQQLLILEGLVQPWLSRDDVTAWLALPDGRRLEPTAAFAALREDESIARADVLVCFRDEGPEAEVAPMLRAAGLEPDPDVLDTWFSSALWPHSTLGWPDPATAELDPGQSPVAAIGDAPDCLSYFYPGSCLVTARDIITLWVARMVLAGLYNLGDVPFTDVFIHANILDGKGERMSKSKGNGIDPVDIIERYGADAMRYVLCELQTGTQDVKLPVQVDSPFSNQPVDLAKAKHGRSIFTYLCPETGKEFDVIGTVDGVPKANPYSERFEIGRNFCNKLWNSARFALLNLEGVPFAPRARADLALEDRWILSRLSRARDEVQRQLEAYNPSAALNAARDFFWNELCDWYLELIKPRLRDGAERGQAQQLLATVLDQILRLLHPFVPFVTEEIWGQLRAAAPTRGVDRALPDAELVIRAAWPEARPDWVDADAERTLEQVHDVVTAAREIRARYQVAPSQRVPVVLVAPADRRATLEGAATTLIGRMCGAESVELTDQAPRGKDAATAVVGDVEIFVPGVVDVEAERRKLEKQREQLTARIGGIDKKLANEGFVAKAPPAVVERERQNLAGLRTQLEALEETLRALGDGD
ncbi:MAG: valine--tRNA ligase [Planctomycetota bacterium]